MNWWLQLLIAVGFYGLAILVHELAHMKKAERLGYATKIRWEERGFTVYTARETTKEEELEILQAGVWWGTAVLLPSIFMIDFLHPLVLLLLWFSYFWASRTDLKNIWRLTDELD